MTPKERATYRNEGVVPAGWRWCPDCNGEGMVCGPDGVPMGWCRRCDEEAGIVPVETAGETTP